MLPISATDFRFGRFRTCVLTILGIGILGFCALPTFAFAQSVALTFDDGFDPKAQPQAALWNQAMIDSLARANIKSILYAAGRGIDSPAGLQLVRNWGLAGHAVGNHTYSHLNFNRPTTSLDIFIADIERNETLLKDMPGWAPRFRFPFLKQGDTAQKRDGLRDWLDAHHYESGEVSIDASDWYYNLRYEEWRKAHAHADPSTIRTAYLDHLWDRARYYDGLSQSLLNRSAKHVILLHMNRINADFLPDVIEMFRGKGWTIISPADAYQDPLYSMKSNVLPAGESILWSLAKQAGFASLRYPAEDGVYEKPELDRLGF